MSLYSEIIDFHPEMTDWRRSIHSHPELGFEEEKTSDFVAEKLTEFGCKVHRGLGITGVVGTLQSGSSTQSIGLRADMDALPIDELNTFKHRSTQAGVMHACGHDGHTSMLLGAAKYLAQSGRFNGKVHFIFQPAEEGIGGAKKMIKDGLFKQFPCDSIFAMHNKPGLEVGKFVVNPGPTMAAGTFFDITIKGKGTHAAKPATGIDPILISAQLVVALQSIVARNIDCQETAVLSVTKMEGGSNYNIIPESVALAGTIRTLSDQVMNEIRTKITSLSESLCAAFGATCNVEFHEKFVTLVNHKEETDFAYGVCESLVGASNIETNVRSMASEDFSFMLNEVPGCYIDIGNGIKKGSCPVHNPSYDFNDDILTLGASYFARVVESKLA